LLCCDAALLKVAADGNWIHIHYQSKLQAKKVLSKNGKVFGGSIMVGVVPCIDKVGTLNFMMLHSTLSASRVAVVFMLMFWLNRQFFSV